MGYLNNTFDTYDPSFDTYDPEFNRFDGDDELDSYRGTKSAKMNGSIDLTITSNIDEDVNISLFAPLFQDAELVRTPATGENTYQPTVLTGTQFQTGAVVATVGQPRVVYYDKLGRLVYERYNADGINRFCVISCQQLGFKSLMKSLESTPFTIGRARMTFTTDKQIDSQVVMYKRTFLGGYSLNPVAPRSSFNPMQQQGLIVDVPFGNQEFNGESGIFYTVKFVAGVTSNVTQINANITMYKKSGKL